MPLLDLERLVDEKVAAELQQMNGQLEQLVADAVDRELQRLVHRLVEQNLNGRDQGEHDEHERLVQLLQSCLYPRIGRGMS